MPFRSAICPCLVLLAGGTIALSAMAQAPADRFEDVTNLGQLIYETQSTWPGNGSYRVAGDRLTTTRNGASPETALFSILRRPKPNGRYEQILRIVEPAKFGPAWGFGDTGHYVIDYTKTEQP